MFAIIFTWIGAVLGIAVLLVMAFGAFVLDFEDALADRRRKRRLDPVAAEGPTAVP
ncbi:MULTISPECIES: hypothetical protein [Amycolatopsis]|uniref:Uncharacterized protein n=1 Tax=Amycolatopsis thermalba TaxID=944492 RepID=A0ABY4NQH3_9PSEU|nr:MULTISPECIES: hypothetical protein [Amycolatopsis]UQS21934.1 hypothetical protein L1857_03395 [Amycolatopsis thermalba]